MTLTKASEQQIEKLATQTQEGFLDNLTGAFFRRIDWWAFWIVLAATFAVYFYTLAPTVTLGGRRRTGGGGGLSRGAASAGLSDLDADGLVFPMDFPLGDVQRASQPVVVGGPGVGGVGGGGLRAAGAAGQPVGRGSPAQRTGIEGQDRVPGGEPAVPGGGHFGRAAAGVQPGAVVAERDRGGVQPQRAVPDGGAAADLHVDVPSQERPAAVCGGVPVRAGPDQPPDPAVPGLGAGGGRGNEGCRPVPRLSPSPRC
jgi:hypothetical protein